MPVEILMPALSPTMTEGKLAKWVKKEGDAVEAGEVIAEIETDKATMEVESVDEGVLGKILVSEGTEGVPVNQLIGLILEDGEDKASLDGYEAANANTKDDSSEVSDKDSGESKSHSDSSSKPAQSKSQSQPQASSQETNNDGRIKASPLARRIAANQGVDLATLKGTGPHGRIIKADVLEAPAGGSIAAQPLPAVGRQAVEYTEIPHTTMRKVIAERLLASKQQVPHFYLNIECQLDTILAARKEMNDAIAKTAGKDQPPAYKLSVNDFVIKAVAMALRAVPAANASWTDAAILQYTNVDVSVAVAIDGGLITPIVKNADQKSLSAISNEMKDLAKRARDNKLAPEEFQGGGFSISNLGMYGIKRFNAIVNPPQACILAVGAGEERVVVNNGQIETATIMDVTLSSDHRVVDGAVGAEFLAAFKQFIENPVTMLA